MEENTKQEKFLLIVIALAATLTEQGIATVEAAFRFGPKQNSSLATLPSLIVDSAKFLPDFLITVAIHKQATIEAIAESINKVQQNLDAVIEQTNKFSTNLTLHQLSTYLLHHTVTHVSRAELERISQIIRGCANLANSNFFDFGSPNQLNPSYSGPWIVSLRLYCNNASIWEDGLKVRVLSDATVKMWVLARIPWDVTTEGCPINDIWVSNTIKHYYRGSKFIPWTENHIFNELTLNVEPEPHRLIQQNLLYTIVAIPFTVGNPILCENSISHIVATAYDETNFQNSNSLQSLPSILETYNRIDGSLGER